MFYPRLSVTIRIAGILTLDVHAQSSNASKVFERVFGISRTIPAETIDAVMELDDGGRLERDTDGDGVVDELWYLDTAKRHTIQPLLVRVVDEDGDLSETGRGDLDSDCYFWDHHADGVFDVVTDYRDDDGDNDVDQMGIFYDKNWSDDKDDITVWWSDDVGDDNRLWYDVNGNYYQQLSQWRTHFSGDELFYQFRLTEDDEKWVNVWEDPFAFYDPDDDECSEVVIRISAVGDDVKNLRYSIDADDDAYGDRTHNYDFSVTALPPEDGMSSAKWSGAARTIRGIETLPLLAWDKTQAYAQQASWGKAMLTWDEINSNTDGDVERDPHERWEGILNHASKRGDFPQVGGPACSEFNKRVEVSHSPASPLTLQYDAADHRFHLVGARYGYLDVDYDFDGTLDAAYTWDDTDGDGILDKRSADVNADGEIDFVQTLEGEGEAFPLTFESIAPAYKKSLDAVLRDSQTFIDAVTFAHDRLPDGVQAILDFFKNELTDYHPETELGTYIRKSPAGARFFMDLVRDRLFVHARSRHGENEQWTAIEESYLGGHYKRAAKLFVELSGKAIPDNPAGRPLEYNGQVYTKRKAVVIEYENPQPIPRDAVPHGIHLDSSKFNDDFNPDNCVVVDGDFRLAWRVVPHQIDDWEFGGRAKISFLADLPAKGKKTYYVFYDPEGKSKASYPILTRAVLDEPGHIAWESDAGAYRFYTGQFDFFGKQQARLLLRHERLIYPLKGVNYHEEQSWGIDALHVGTTSGLGGLTLYVDGKAYPIQSPAGEGDVTFDYRVLGAGPVRAGVEITASNVIPATPDKQVQIRCFIYAKRPETYVQVRLPEGLDQPCIGVGLLKLDEGVGLEDVSMGLLGAWGRQGDDIGHVGLAVAANAESTIEISDLAHERQLICEPDYSSNSSDFAHFRYCITGAWRRGMQYPIAPTGENWQRQAEDLAYRLNSRRSVQIENLPDAAAR